MDRYNKYQTKQLNAHTYTCIRNSWWLVLGWVTTKEYHPLPQLNRQTSAYGALTKIFNNKIINLHITEEAGAKFNVYTTKQIKKN